MNLSSMPSHLHCTKRSAVQVLRAKRSNLPFDEEIAHLHCTERSAVHVSADERRLAMTGYYATKEATC